MPALTRGWQGLDPALKLVTVMCTEDFYTGEKIAYEFAWLRAEDPGRIAATTAVMVAAFDGARSLCAFNGVRFDIPFLQASLGVLAHGHAVGAQDDGHPRVLTAAARPHLQPQPAVRGQLDPSEDLERTARHPHGRGAGVGAAARVLR